MNDNLQTVLNNARGLANDLGVDLAEVAAALAGAADGQQPAAPTGTGLTVAGYVPRVLAVMAGKLSETRRTYKTGLQLMASGIVLSWPYRHDKSDPMLFRPWSNDRVEAWLREARRLNNEENLGLELPANADACDRDTHEAAIIWRGFGDVPLASLTKSDVETAITWTRLRARANAAVRNQARRKEGRKDVKHSGDGAALSLIAAVNFMFKQAAGDKLIEAPESPAEGINDIKRPPSKARRPLTHDKLADVRRVFCETGQDPELDGWLYFFHRWTGARQEGAWRLTVGMIDQGRQLVYIPDKGSVTKRGGTDEQDAIPASRELIDGLLAFAASRGSVGPDDRVFVTRRKDADGRPRAITSRHFEGIYKRMRKHTDWADEAGFGVHHLRHTLAAEVEDFAGRRFKRRLLRHRPNGQTDVYGPASLEELAWVLAQMTGAPHPLAEAPRTGR